MAPTASKANYRSYEAQARMVRAIVAAHPDVKWNYKEIVACYGSDMTEHALQHRFRRFRAQSVIIQEGRSKGFDMRNLDIEKDLPVTQEAVDKRNIAKYFGQSTADGIQFQFRGIKKDAEELRRTEQNGGDVASCLSLNGGSTGALATPTKLATPGRSSGGRSGAKRARPPTIKRTSSDDDDLEDAVDDDFSDQDTPTKPKRARTTAAAAANGTPGQKTGTPSRHAAAKANVTIADAAAQLRGNDSSEEVETAAAAAAAPPAGRVAGRAADVVPPSIFGPVDQKPVVASNGLAHDDFHDSAFSSGGMDAFLGSGDFYPGVNDRFDDYEI